MTTDARNATRCSSWSSWFRSGCSAFCRVTRTSTTSSGPIARWRWLSGDLTGEERGAATAAFRWSGTVNRAGRARRGRDAPVQEDRGRRWTISRSTCPSTLVRRREIFLDVASTDDPVHGNQEGRHFHGYSCCYLPLCIVRASCAVRKVLGYMQYSDVQNFLYSGTENCESAMPRTPFSQIPPQATPRAPASRPRLAQSSPRGAEAYSTFVPHTLACATLADLPTGGRNDSRGTERTAADKKRHSANASSCGTTLRSRLRPANVDPAAGAEELARERKRRPETVVRGDDGFCRDGTWCEDNGVDDLFGLSRNARLTERRQLRKSRRRCISTGEARFCDFRYRIRTSWSRTRRAVAKGLPGPRGARFVVTSPGCKRAGARILYEKLYCARGENRGAAACSPTGP